MDLAVKKEKKTKKAPAPTQPLIHENEKMSKRTTEKMTEEEMTEEMTENLRILVEAQCDYFEHLRSFNMSLEEKSLSIEDGKDLEFKKEDVTMAQTKLVGNLHHVISSSYYFAYNGEERQACAKCLKAASIGSIRELLSFAESMLPMWLDTPVSVLNRKVGLVLMGKVFIWGLEELKKIKIP